MRFDLTSVLKVPIYGLLFVALASIVSFGFGLVLGMVELMAGGGLGGVLALVALLVGFPLIVGFANRLLLTWMWDIGLEMTKSSLWFFGFAVLALARIVDIPITYAGAQVFKAEAFYFTVFVWVVSSFVYGVVLLSLSMFWGKYPWLLDIKGEKKEAEESPSTS